MSIRVLVATREFWPLASLWAAGLVPAGGQHGIDRAEELLGLWGLGGGRALLESLRTGCGAVICD